MRQTDASLQFYGSYDMLCHDWTNDTSEEEEYYKKCTAEHFQRRTLGLEKVTYCSLLYCQLYSHFDALIPVA